MSKQDAPTAPTAPNWTKPLWQSCFRPIVALPWRKVRTLTFSNLLVATLVTMANTIKYQAEVCMELENSAWNTTKPQKANLNANSISFSCQTGISLSFQHLSLLSSVYVCQSLLSGSRTFVSGLGIRRIEEFLWQKLLGLLHLHVQGLVAKKKITWGLHVQWVQAGKM